MQVFKRVEINLCVTGKMHIGKRLIHHFETTRMLFPVLALY